MAQLLESRLATYHGDYLVRMTAYAIERFAMASVHQPTTLTRPGFVSFLTHRKLWCVCGFMHSSLSLGGSGDVHFLYMY